MPSDMKTRWCFECSKAHPGAVNTYKGDTSPGRHSHSDTTLSFSFVILYRKHTGGGVIIPFTSTPGDTRKLSKVMASGKVRAITIVPVIYG